MKTNYRTAANAGNIRIHKTHSVRRRLAQMAGISHTSGAAYRAWMNMTQDEFIDRMTRAMMVGGA